MDPWNPSIYMSTILARIYPTLVGYFHIKPISGPCNFFGMVFLKYGLGSHQTLVPKSLVAGMMLT